LIEEQIELRGVKGEEIEALHADDNEPVFKTFKVDSSEWLNYIFSNFIIVISKYENYE